MSRRVEETSAVLLAAVGITWLLGFVILRFLTARVASKAGRGEFFELLRDLGWMLERRRPWSILGRVTLAWLLLIPALAFLLIAFSFYLRHH